MSNDMAAADLTPEQSRSVAQLRQALAAGHTPKYVFFWGHTPARPGRVDKSCLSQWYPASFHADDVHYPTAEHYMMAEKARLFQDETALAAILAASSPGAAKALGRQVRGFDPVVWEAHRFDIVSRGSYLKFAQNEALADFLRGTRSRVLVEASPRDAIWGIGLAADDPAAADPALWPGLNLLGFALMAARAQL